MPKQYRGFLKCCDGVFLLDEIITHIGYSSKADLVLDMVADQESLNDQAQIEYDERDCRFYLQNLSPISAGPGDATYVNDCEVVAAAVPLHCGDLIRFGRSGRLFQFEAVEQPDIINTSHCDGEKEETIVCCNGLPQLSSILKRSTPSSTYTISDQQNNVVTSRRGTDRPRWVIGPKANEERQVQIMKLLQGTKIPRELKNLVCEELGRLNHVECDSLLHCDVISQLRDEVTHLQNRLRQIDTGCCVPVCGDTDQKFLQLEKCCLCSSGCCGSNQADNEPGEGESSVRSVNGKAITLQSLVTDMKHDMANKDTTICKLSGELDTTKQQLLDRDCTIRALTHTLRYTCARYGYTDDFTQKFQELIDEQKELLDLRRKSTSFESSQNESMRQIALLDKECEQLNMLCQQQSKDLYQKQAEACCMKTQLEDFERCEQLVRVDMEQLRSRFERIRGLVTQLAFGDKRTSDGQGDPVEQIQDKLLSDEDLLGTACELIIKRDEMSKRVQMLENELKRYQVEPEAKEESPEEPRDSDQRKSTDE